MSNSIQNVIKFYRDCYQFEHNTETVTNFFSKSLSHLYFPKTFEFLGTSRFAMPMGSDWGKDIDLELALSSSEKKLICGTFFVKGKIEILGKKHTLFTPFFLHDVKFEKQKDIYFLELEHDSIQLNPIAVQYLNALSIEKKYQYDDLSDMIIKDKNIFDFEKISFLIDFLEKEYPLLDSYYLKKRIHSHSPILDLTEIYRSRKSEYENTLLPDIIIGLVEKSKNSRGIINELNTLSTKQHNNEGLLAEFLLNNFRKKSSHATKKKELFVPVSLSNQQEKMIHSASNAKMTLVVGPPGTGKSFSIAALAIQAMHDGKRVLIASKNVQACQVVYNKINQEIGVRNVAINASKARYRITIAAKLKNIANGIGIIKTSPQIMTIKENEVINLKRHISSIIKKIVKAEKNEINWGKRLIEKNPGVITKLRNKWLEYQSTSRELIWELNKQFHKIDSLLKEKERKLIQLKHKNKLHKLLAKSRADLLKYMTAFQTNRGNAVKEIFDNVNFKVVLEALPIWICKSSEISNILPLDEGLFDLFNC